MCGRWRAFRNERRTDEKSGFVDGDLIELMLDLPPNKVADVAKQLGMDAQDLVRRVEDLTRIH
jgi:hypothetical protein